MLNRIEEEQEKKRKKPKWNDENVKKKYKIVVLMHLYEEVVHKTIQFNSIQYQWIYPTTICHGVYVHSFLRTDSTTARNESESEVCVCVLSNTHSLK